MELEPVWNQGKKLSYPCILIMDVMGDKYVDAQELKRRIKEKHDYDIHPNKIGQLVTFRLTELVDKRRKEHANGKIHEYRKIMF